MTATLKYCYAFQVICNIDSKEGQKKINYNQISNKLLVHELVCNNKHS